MIEYHHARLSDVDLTKEHSRKKYFDLLDLAISAM